MLDAFLEQDKNSRCGIEVVGGKGKIFITGEVTSKAKVDIEPVVKSVLQDIGYKTDYEIINNIGMQSPDIAQGVDTGGAGDQGMMFGYACRETEYYLPKAMVILQALSKYYDALCHSDKRFLPDGKAQITGIYDDDKNLIGIKDFTISYQNTEVEREETDKILIDFVTEICHEFDIDNIETFHINPTGKFLIGGFDGDAGLTGRKIVVDSYHSFANVGGGAFCVDGDTEFITPNGFKKIRDYKKGDYVAEWDNGELKFVEPYYYHCGEAEKMYHIYSTNALDMVLSENHDMVIRTSKGNIIKKAVKCLFDEASGKIKNGNNGTIPTSFRYYKEDTKVELTDDEIRLQVAFCADGTLSKDNRASRIRVLKDRKIIRLRELLNKTNIAFKEKVYKDGYTYFYFSPPIYEKSLKVCFSDCNSHQMRVIADESQLWDGGESVFRTTHKDDADFMQFVFMTAYETSVSIFVDDRVGQKYNDGNYIRKSICYEVRRKQNRDTQLRGEGQCDIKSEVFVPDDGKMYCFTVPSGMLVLRRNNKIFITGNCGKDPTKVDRSAAYKARQLAIRFLESRKDIKWCEVQLSYAIGIDKPLAIYVRTDKGDISDLDYLYDECTPNRIISDLHLRDVKYYYTAMFGHFGNKSFPWEKCNV